MTPNRFIPFWDALSDRDRRFVTENLETGVRPGNGFFSSKRLMHGGIVFLLKGHIRIFQSSNEGREITMVTMNPGDSYLVHPGYDHPARKGQLRFETSEDCEYAFLSRTVLMTICSRCPAALEFVLDSEDRLIRRISENLSYAVFLSIRGNLARTLLEKSQFAGTVRETHEELANELGTTRVVISRELKKLEEFGLIKLGRGEIEILYRDGLIELAE